MAQKEGFPASVAQKCLLLVALMLLGILIINLSVVPNEAGALLVKSSLPKCQCVRKVPKMQPSLESSSICDVYSSMRGTRQKVVSYSFFGNSSSSSGQDQRVATHYLDQIAERAREIQASYPGWVMRVYYHLEQGDSYAEEKLCQNWCNHPHLDLCDVQDLPSIGDLRGLQPIGRTWRFAAMMDTSVDMFLSRDLDSAILPREVAAVEEWVKTNRTFHIMRDHPSHNGYMLAGLWGAKTTADREKLRNLGGLIFIASPRHYWDFDQALLRRLIWPEAAKSSLQHDSYSCTFGKFNTYHATQPFPTRRTDKLYVGWGPIKGDPGKTGIKPCPKSCRLDESWNFC